MAESNREMKNSLLGSLLMSAVVLASVAKGDASTTHSYVYTSNKSTEYAWVTAYGTSTTVGGKIVADIKTTMNNLTLGATGFPGDTIQGAWCVGPSNTMDKHTLSANVHAVRIELKGYQCAANTKDVLDKTVAFLGADPKAGITSITGGNTVMIGTAPENVPGGNVQSDGQGPGGPSYYDKTIPFAVSASSGAQ
jgi:hypothetical protein